MKLVKIKKLNFSVIIPTLNEEKYLGKCLKSVMSMNYPKSDYEVIVVDGNSEDKTREIARKYGAKVIVSKIRRCGYQRQLGVNQARGELLSFIDADYVVDKNLLNGLEEIFNDKKVTAVQGKILLYDATFLENLIGADIFNMFLWALVPLGLFATGGNMAIRKSVIDKIGGFNLIKKTAEDIELLKKARKYGSVAYGAKALGWTSTRRIRKWGYAKTLSFQISNLIRYTFTGKSCGEYEDLR